MNDFAPAPGPPPYTSFPVGPVASYPQTGIGWPYRPLRSTSGLGVAVIVLAALVTACQVLTAVTAWSAGSYYQEAARLGIPIEQTELLPYDAAVLPFSLLLVVSLVVSCIWLHRARRNAEALAPDSGHTRSAVWVWLGWLVPVVSLWFPFQVVRDVRNASVRPFPEQVVTGFWWAAWLAFLFGNQIVSRLLPMSGQIDEQTVGALGPIETINAVFCVVALALWVKIVRDVNGGQKKLAAQL